MSSFRYIDADHSYWIGDKRIPGVSEILAPAVDLSMVPPQVMERKRQIGKAVHLLCQWYDEGEEIDPDSIDPACLPYFDAWRRFCDDYKPQFGVIEGPMVSEKYLFAGTPDRARCVIRDEHWTLDIKTVAQVSKVTGLQTAAYSELAGNRCARRAAVQLREDGKYQFHEFPDSADWPVFLSLLNFKHWRTSNGI